MSLTREQQDQQQRAVYGLPSQAFDPSRLTPEQLRQVTEWAAQQNARNTGIVKEFDLNNPPTPPYRHQEFPKMLYRLDKSGKQRNLIVKDVYHMEAMLREGWSKEPLREQEVDIAPKLDRATQAEVNAKNEILHPAPKRQPSGFQKYNEKRRAEAAAKKAQAQAQSLDG